MLEIKGETVLGEDSENQFENSDFSSFVLLINLHSPANESKEGTNAFTRIHGDFQMGPNNHTYNSWPRSANKTQLSVE